MASDNIAQVSASGLKLVFLAPGIVIQWLNYMFVGNLKSYGKVRQQTRLARSPIMTWVYSIMFWAGLILFALAATVEESTPPDIATTTLVSDGFLSIPIEFSFEFI